MKLESEKFLIVKKIKIFIYQLNTIVSLFPNRDYVGKNKIVEDSFLLLSDIYLINFSDKSDNLKKANVLTKINMLDFYLEKNNVGLGWVERGRVGFGLEPANKDNF